MIQVSKRTRTIVEIAAVALLYFATARLGQLLAIPPGNITPVWIPSGIILGAVLLFGNRVWPGIFLGAFAGNLWAYFSADSLDSVLGCLLAGTANATGDTLCALVGAHLIIRTTGGRDPFDRAGDVVKFVVFGCLLTPGISALFGVTSLALAGLVPWSNYAFVLGTWWTGDGVGVLVVAPLLLAWRDGWKGLRFGREELVFMLMLPVASLGSMRVLPDVPGLVILPVLMWGVFRIKRRLFCSGLVAEVVIVVAMSVWHHGPFAGGDLTHNLLNLQLFTILMTMPALVLRASIAEKNQALIRLGDLNRDLDERVADRTQRLELDLIQRKLAEAEARESRRLLQSVVDNSHVFIYAKDLQGRFIMASQPLATLFGQASHYQLLGRTTHDFLPKETADNHWAHDLEVIARGAVIRSEETVPTPAGLLTYDSVKFPLSNDENTVYAVCGVSIDVTARNRAEKEKARIEEQLHQAMKMESIGRLAGGVAHDFNNLLTVILGQLSLVLEDLDTSSPLRQSLADVIRAAESAASLTKQLLAFSRKEVVQPRLIKLNDLVASQSMMLARLVPENIVFSTVLAGDLQFAEADPARTEQVLVNLVVNARDAMPNGGKLVVETANAELGKEYCDQHPEVVPGSYVMLSVADSGHGMGDEVKKHLFEPFFTTKKMGRGTGLGLATSYGVIRQAGGTIDVDSTLGQGTTFRVYLPAASAPPVLSDVDPREPEHCGGLQTILVVEDEQLVRDLLVEILERSGFNVLAAEDAEVALATAGAREAPIDLLVTDVMMPGLNGRELADRVKAIHPEVAVLFASGYSEDVLHGSGADAERLNFIAKPFTHKALTRKVREVLDSRV